jgi:uncharacterized protein (DUF2252 family)
VTNEPRRSTNDQEQSSVTVAKANVAPSVLRMSVRGVPYVLELACHSWKQRRELGKDLRRKVPRESHATYSPAKHRPRPLDVIAASNTGRQAELIPLRMGRMASSPFGFLRGSASVMAWDLSRTPVSGIPVIMDGDAHIHNFGLFGTPQRDIVFDLNDFDETTIGPWEWDLKRLVASVNVAARENGFSRKERRIAVMHSVEGYRLTMSRLQGMGVLNVWYLHAFPGQDNPLIQSSAKARSIFDRSISKAREETNARLLQKSAQKSSDGTWRFHEDPPILTRVNRETVHKVVESLRNYSDTLPRERRYMLGRYRVVDVVHRAVGVGSVGTRAYLALLFGNGDDDPLFLQVKEATTAAHAPYLAPQLHESTHQGRRVVIGQHALQSSSDVLLGWTTIDGRPFYVRQMKNMKGSIPIECLADECFNSYAWACGAILARAHARTSDAAVLAGYCGNSQALDDAFADWAESYGDQVEADHEALVKGIKAGRIKATMNL